MREIDKTIILMISKVISAANVFVLSVFFARLLTKTDYGTYIQINMLISLLVLLLSIGIPSGLFFFLPKNIKQKHLIRRSFFLMLVIGLIASLIMMVLNNYISGTLNNPELKRFMVWVGACLICNMCSQIVRPVLMVAKESLVLSAITAGKGILFFISMVTCLYIYPGVQLLVYALFAVSFVELAVAIWALYKYSEKFSNSIDAIRVSLKQQIKFSLPLAASGVLWILGREIDKYIISYYLYPSDLAVYARGAVEIPLIHILASTIADIYLPEWVRLYDNKDHTKLIGLWHTTITKTAMIMFPIFILLQLIGHDFIVLLYSKEYIGSVVIFSIYLFLVPIQLTQYSAVIESSGKPILITIGFVSQVSLNIIFSVLLIKKIGTTGPAIVTVVSTYLWVGYMLFITSRIYKYSISKIFPWKRLCRIMCLSVFSGLVVLLIKKFSGSVFSFDFLKNTELIYGTRICIYSIFFTLLYLLIMFITNTFEDDDKATILRWLFIRRK